MGRYTSMILCILVIGLVPALITGADTIMITGNRLNVRSGPGRTYDIISIVNKNEQFEMLQQQEEWVQISVEGVLGWVPAAAITVVADNAIQRLIKQADYYFQRQQFTTPAEANAYELYRQVLQIEPDNVYVQKRIQQMARTYKIWAERAKEKNETEKAVIFYQRYLYLIPDDEQVKGVLRLLDQPDVNRAKPLKILRLRSEPGTLSQQHIVHIIPKYSFHHPADWTKYGLSPSITGNIRHDYSRNTAHGVPVVLDHATQLMWLQQGPTEPMAWKNANEYIEQLNKNGVAGYTGWRLPTIEELASLLEPRKTQAGLYLDPLFGTDVLWCWSADRSPSPDSAWYISFNSGGIQQQPIKNTAFVLAVRSQY